jgi:2-polyprenyl-6-methoxyphenol hydroxylase-like FAD-dependent oxidoreductase
VDVAVAGGGPAGLAVAIGAASRGLSAVVFEQRQPWMIDKACGEGILPPGLRALEALGVTAHLDREGCAPIAGIRYVDGAIAEGRFRRPGLGVRRTTLIAAMRARAREVGVRIVEGVGIVDHRRTAAAIEIARSDGLCEEAAILIAADGLRSRLRAREGLEATVISRRFGARRHFEVEAPDDLVEVHLGDRTEAYVTPAGPRQVGVAILWDADHVDARGGFEALLSRFPRLAARIARATAASRILGAGPLERAVRARASDRFALVGDAAGYVDAITGEGLSLAFVSAAALVEILPRAIARGADRASLAGYERAAAQAFSTYAAITRSVLWLSRRPRLRRLAIAALGRAPRLFDVALDRTVG